MSSGAARVGGGVAGPRTALVIGGGIAGIAASLRLGEMGVRVTLLEGTRRMGGRATSHVDPKTGEVLDNAQHVTMGACSAYNALLERLGVADLIEWSSTQTWIEPGGRTTTIRPGGWAAPLHLAGSFARARFLSALDKAAIAAAMPLVVSADRERWRSRTFLEFLEHAAQPALTIRRFWEPVVVSACNLGVARVSAVPALMVFQEGILGGGGASAIGVPSVPLGRLYDGVEASLRERGGRVVLGARVERLEEHGGGVKAWSGDGACWEGDAAVLAVAGERVGAVLGERAGGLVPPALEASAIVGVHLRVDRPVLSMPHAVLVGGTAQWLFRKDASGRSLHGVVSAAPGWLLELSEEEIIARVWGDVVTHIPAARDARVVWGRAIRNRLATFAATPEFEAQRPQAGLIGAGSRISLAGDFTATGWPATMEGATRSGIMAASAIVMA